jgi:hypothetical protein
MDEVERGSDLTRNGCLTATGLREEGERETVLVGLLDQIQLVDHDVRADLLVTDKRGEHAIVDQTITWRRSAWLLPFRLCMRISPLLRRATGLPALLLQLPVDLHELVLDHRLHDLLQIPLLFVLGLVDRAWVIHRREETRLFRVFTRSSQAGDGTCAAAPADFHLHRTLLDRNSAVERRDVLAIQVLNAVLI